MSPPRAVWQPLAFVYIYNVLQIGNSAWNQYLKSTLEFSSTQINLIYIASSVLLYFGIISYKFCMMTWSWRYVYIICTLLSGFFSAMQILLIVGITFGLPPFAFALGDDAFAEFIVGIQFLPTTIMVCIPTFFKKASRDVETFRLFFNHKLISFTSLLLKNSLNFLRWLTYVRR